MKKLDITIDRLLFNYIKDIIYADDLLKFGIVHHFINYDANKTTGTLMFVLEREPRPTLISVCRIDIADPQLFDTLPWLIKTRFEKHGLE